MHSVNKRIFITFPNYPLFKKQKRILSKNEKKKKKSKHFGNGGMSLLFLILRENAFAVDSGGSFK